jgi:hypothetical protein
MGGGASLVTDVLVQVMAGLVVYSGTLLFAVRISDRSGDVGRWWAAGGAFVLIVASTVTATTTHQFVLAAVVAYLAAGLLNRAVQDPPVRRLDRYFTPGASRLFDGVELPARVNTLLLARTAAVARRQGRFATASLRAMLVVRREPTGEFTYDVTKTYVYAVLEAAEIPVRIRLLPRLPHLPTSSPTVSHPVRTDLHVDKWTISYWPTVDKDTWQRASASLQAEISLRKSRDPAFHIEPALRRLETTDATGDLTELEFRCTAQFTPEIDTMRLTLRGVPHLGTSPVLHFYAWDVCEGGFDFRVQLDQTLVDEHRTALVYPVTSSQIPVELEHGRDYAEARFRPGDLVILPDDAVVVVLRPPSP